VRIRFEGDWLCLQVRDDGRGLPPPGERRGQGLSSVERRVRSLGGTHGFAAPPGGGTQLTVRVPLQPGAQAGASSSAPSQGSPNETGPDR
jgi:signal transduction histidine kinase